MPIGPVPTVGTNRPIPGRGRLTRPGMVPSRGVVSGSSIRPRSNILQNGGNLPQRRPGGLTPLPNMPPPTTNPVVPPRSNRVPQLTPDILQRLAARRLGG